jgi:hypothetical protein
MAEGEIEPKEPPVRANFTPTEDAQLLALVQRYGKHWTQLAEEMPGRTGEQCRHRWSEYLNPDLKTDEFTEQEDRLLEAIVKAPRLRWSVFRAQFPGKSDTRLKNRWNVLDRKRQGKKTRQRRRDLVVGERPSPWGDGQHQNGSGGGFVWEEDPEIQETVPYDYDLALIGVFEQ